MLPTDALIRRKFVTLFIFLDQQRNSLTFPGFPGRFQIPRLSRFSKLLLLISIYSASPPHLRSVTQKTVQIHTAFPILQRHSAHPSHHHPFRPLQTIQICFLHRPGFNPGFAQVLMHSGQKPCVSFPLCGTMHPRLSG